MHKPIVVVTAKDLTINWYAVFGLLCQTLPEFRLRLAKMPEICPDLTSASKRSLEEARSYPIKAVA